WSRNAYFLSYVHLFSDTRRLAALVYANPVNDVQTLQESVFNVYAGISNNNRVFFIMSKGRGMHCHGRTSN
ncbi:hypothetical protein C0J52_17419, partial [Blattella germanica]